MTVSLLTSGQCTHPEAVSRRGASWRATTFPSLVAVIRHPEAGVILYDTGYSPRYFTETARFPDSLYARLTPVSCQDEDTAVAQLARDGIAAGEVQRIILSHFHADHVGGTKDFPNARFVYLRDALESTRTAGRLGRVRRGFLPGLLPPDLEARSADAADHAREPSASRLGDFGPGRDLLGDGTVIMVELPGHAPGHLGLLVRTGGPELLLVGDACWSTRAITHLELPHPVVRFVTYRWSAYRGTISTLHRLSAERPDLLIVPSHCPAAIGRARAILGTAP